MSNNSALTPARPFAPDDFKRDRPANLIPPASNLHKTAIRSPMISPRSILQSQSQTSSINDEGYSSVDSRASSRASNGTGGGGNLDNWNGVSKSLPRTSAATGKFPQLKEWQDMADKEWQSMKDKSRSEGQRSSSPLLQSSLTRQALMVKSNSTQTLSALTSRPFQQQEVADRSSNDFNRGAADDSSVHFATRSSWDSAAPAPIKYPGKTPRRYSRVKGQHRGSTPISDSEYDRYSPDKRASIEAGAQSILSSTSSRFSLGGDSTRDLLSRIDHQKLATNSHDQMLRARSRRSKSLFSSNQLDSNVDQIETTNVLSSEEKIDQMKRSNKLAEMLGEEWRQQRIGEDNPNQQYQNGTSSSSPLKDIVARRSHYKQRRQSEPLQAPFLAEIFSSKERNRSSSDAYMLNPARPINKRGASMTPSSTIVPPLTPLPLGVHPKAAAILGLCVLPSGATPISPHQRIEEQFTPGHPTSSSSVEMLKDSESLFSMDQTYAEIQRSRVQANSSDNPQDEAEEEEGEDEDEDEEAALCREERRRRVRKISRWLGAAVPPHLVQPFPNNLQQRQMIGSGYNQDEAPPLPMTDYMSGIPLHQLEKRSRSHEGISWNSTGASSLEKAKAVVNAKLNRKNNHDNSKEGQQYHSPEGIESEWIYNGSVPMMTTKTITDSREHQTSVKRNHKLTAVFGQAPPISMLSEKSPTSPNRKDIFGPPTSGYHRGTTQNYHLDNLDRSKIKTSSADTFNDNQSIFSSSILDSRRASSQYRLSIESLDYLLRKNPPLLKDLVNALEEDDDEMETYKTISGRSNTPIEGKDTSIECTGLPINRSLSQESMTESTMNHEIGQSGTLIDKSSQNNDELNSNLTEKLEMRKRELKVKRHQKLGRWFGELPPREGETIRRDDDGILIGSQTVEMIDEGNQTKGKTRFQSNRMAPRSAGSAIKRRIPHPRQFSLNDVLNSIEGEVKDDEHLPSWEKEELQDRLRQLRNDSKQSNVW